MSSPVASTAPIRRATVVGNRPARRRYPSRPVRASLSGLTAVGALVTGIEIWLEHDRASFGNKMMWLPVVLTPAVVCGRGGRHLLPSGCQDRAPAGVDGGGDQQPAGSVSPPPWDRPTARADSPWPATTWRWARRPSRRCCSAWSVAWDCWPPSCGGSADGEGSPRSTRGHHAGDGRAAIPRLRRHRAESDLGRSHPGGGPRPARAAPPLRFFSADQEPTARALVDRLLAQDDEPRVPVIEMIDQRLLEQPRRRVPYEDMPEDWEAWPRSIEMLDDDAHASFGRSFSELGVRDQMQLVEKIRCLDGDWHGLPANHLFKLWMRYACDAYYSHPWAWNEIGFGGPAYPRGYKNLGLGKREPWEVQERDASDPVPWAERVEQARAEHVDAPDTDRPRRRGPVDGDATPSRRPPPAATAAAPPVSTRPPPP